MITHPDIEEYLQKVVTVPIPILTEMEQFAQKQNLPIVGPLVGRLLISLIKFGHVHTVLECGSGFGYSAMWMALALSENAKITCIELDDKNIQQAKKFFEKAELLHKVTFLKGDANEIVPELATTYDLILNDIDKGQYSKILPHLIKRVRVGGMIFSTNVLWQGKGTQQTVNPAIRAIQEYNEMLIKEDCLWNSFIPLGEGIALSIKLRR